ncbi:host attachment protein [Bradyrhizobium sp. MOS003]|uniref:host attachment protein n=1 Tax=Bradyrhizobium sp. MOS003 TaxID=2133946 RepID=UPI001FE10C23|nr:host attachment protein [Bradyrhizobium sp. MOS003]
MAVRYRLPRPDRILSSAHAQGSGRPGRVGESSHSGRRSAVEMTDWHELEEKRFARQVAAAAERLLRAEHAPSLIVVAPPQHAGGASFRFS